MFEDGVQYLLRPPHRMGGKDNRNCTAQSKETKIRDFVVIPGMEVNKEYA